MAVPSLRIIESTSIGLPPGSTPNLASIPLTYFDILWYGMFPVERLFFYNFPHPISHFLSSTLPSLKSSLSLTLAKFYPLAGVIRPISGTDKERKHEIYCTKDDSVWFTVAESHDDFQHLSSQDARLVSRLEPFVPCLTKCGQSELIAVQATVFPDQGVVIGIAVSHAVCDGTSSMQFVQSWAATCHSSDFYSSSNPVINRALVPDPSDLYAFLSNMGPKEPPSKEESHQAPPMDPDMVIASFTLTRDHIQGLKRLILHKAEERGTSFHCSTLVVAFAYAWITHVKARKFDSNNKHSLLLPADFRARIQPTLPPTYFGNCVGACISQIEFADMISENGLFLTALAIGKSIEGLSVEKLRENWIKAFETFSNPHCVLTTAGSPKFRVYEVDFGWGKPARVDIFSVSKSGAMAMAESEDMQGGVEIGLALPRHVMDCFRKYFSWGLKI